VTAAKWEVKTGYRGRLQLQHEERNRSVGAASEIPRSSKNNIAISEERVVEACFIPLSWNEGNLLCAFS
jgi:hypothetical protein